MVDSTQWRGALPEFNDQYWEADGSTPDYLNDEATTWLDWLIRSRYADVRGISMVRNGAGLELRLYWIKPLDQIFRPTEGVPPQRVDTILDRLIERTRSPNSYTYQHRRPDFSTIVSVLDDGSEEFHYEFQFFVNKPKHPAGPRNATWLARRMRMEFKKLGFEHTWPQAALANFNTWLELDGEDIFIVRPRDMEEQPLTRRIRARKQNDNDTKKQSALGVGDNLPPSRRVLPSRLRVRSVPRR